MSAKGWPWDALDLPRAPETTAEVRRAYAKRLKTIDQAKDIAGFEALRKAYEAALQRVEQKAQKAAAKAEAKAIAAPSGLNDLGSVDGAAAPSIPEPDRGSLPDSLAADAGQPATLPDPPPIQSPEDRLRLHLNLLSETNILMSPNAQVQAILDEPEFQSPELEPMLRHGLAEYIRSQLLWNHLNEPYLRHPGVTADLLKAMDARFGWLSDYTAFRRDFWGDTQILEAMVDAAGVERSSPTSQLMVKGEGFQQTRFLIFGFCFIALHLYNATRNSSPGTAAEIFGTLAGLSVVALILGGGGVYLYGYVRKHASNAAAIFATVWMALGPIAILLGNKVVPGWQPAEWPFLLWVTITAPMFCLWVLWRLQDFVRSVLARRRTNRK